MLFGEYEIKHVRLVGAKSVKGCAGVVVVGCKIDGLA